jgi:hypothetical protein
MRTNQDSLWELLWSLDFTAASFDVTQDLGLIRQAVNS